MPNVASTSTLIAQAECIDQCVPPGMQLSVLVAIFAQLAGMPINTSTLLSNAVCVQACVPEGMMMAVLVSLASQIVTSGGTVAGGGQIMAYSGASPTADGLVPTNQGMPAMAYKANGAGPQYTWNQSSHVWQ